MAAINCALSLSLPSLPSQIWLQILQVLARGGERAVIRALYRDQAGFVLHACMNLHLSFSVTHAHLIETCVSLEYGEGGL